MQTLRHNQKFINSIILDRVIGDDPFYKGQPTLVELSDGTSASYDIVGEATASDLPASMVKRVRFGSTVSSIADGLFMNSSQLEHAYTGWSCLSIGERSFNDSPSLREVVVGPSIRVLGSGQYAFSGSAGLSSITFHPDSQLSAVGYGAIRTTALPELTVISRASRLSFANWSFSNNANLSTLVLDVSAVPALQTDPGGFLGALDGCQHLTSTSYDGQVVVPDDLKSSFLADTYWSYLPASKLKSFSEFGYEPAPAPQPVSTTSWMVSCFYGGILIWGGEGEQKPDPLSALYRRWSFDTLYDSVAGIPMTLYGNATLADGALVIDGNNQSHTNYAQLSGNNFPAEYDGGITIEFWQNTTDRRNWARVFDFGFDTSNYTFFSTTMGSNNYARTAVKCGSGEDYVDSTYMTPGETWHTAVVYDLTSQTGKTLLSVCSFSPSGTMTKSTVTMNQDMAHAMSAWNINYLGRSFFADKDFDGSIQEFRIWNKTLTEEELVQNDTLGPDTLPQEKQGPDGEQASWIELPNLASIAGPPALSVIEDPTDDMKIQVDWMVTNTTGDCLFGIPYPDDDNDDYRIFNRFDRTYYDRGRDRISNVSSLFPRNQRTLVEFGNYYISSEYGQKAYVASTYTPPTSPLGFYGYAYIYGLKIWDGDTLVRDMVPWRDGNGVGCLSCQVTNKLYYARDGVTVNVPAD